MIWTKDMSAAPKDGTPVLLDCGDYVRHARWFAPWECWLLVTDPNPTEDDDYWGIGSGVPLAWMPEPKPGTHAPFSS